MKINTIIFLSLLILPLTQACQRDAREPLVEPPERLEEPSVAATGNGRQANADILFPNNVMVYRHHPTYISNLAARTHDDELVLKSLNESGIAYFAHGSLGRSGSQIEIGRADLKKWRELINALINTDQLKYYTAFGLDKNGHGFVDISD